MLTYRELARRRAAWNATHRGGLEGYISQGTSGGYTFDPSAYQTLIDQANASDPSADYSDYTDLGTGGSVTSTGVVDASGNPTTGGATGFMGFLQSLFQSGTQSFNSAQGAPVAPATPNSYSGVTQPPPASTTPVPAAPASGVMANLTNFSTPYPYLALGGLVILLAVMKRGSSGSGEGTTIIR